MLNTVNVLRRWMPKCLGDVDLQGREETLKSELESRRQPGHEHELKSTTSIFL